MKKALIAICMLFVPFLYGQDLHGAWATVASNDEGIQIEHTLTFTDGFFSEAIYEKDDGKFLGTKGGSYISNGEAINFSYEFSNEEPELVGETKSKSYTIKNNVLELGGMNWSRIRSEEH